LLHADGLALATSSEQDLHYALYDSSACDQAGMKTSTKIPRNYVSPETQIGVNTLQQVETFQYSTLGRYSRVTEGETR